LFGFVVIPTEFPVGLSTWLLLHPHACFFGLADVRLCSFFCFFVHCVNGISEIILNKNFIFTYMFFNPPQLLPWAALAELRGFATIW
jgi:hypothetical protein